MADVTLLRPEYRSLIASWVPGGIERYAPSNRGEVWTTSGSPTAGSRNGWLGMDLDSTTNDYLNLAHVGNIPSACPFVSTEFTVIVGISGDTWEDNGALAAMQTDSGVIRIIKQGAIQRPRLLMNQVFDFAGGYPEIEDGAYHSVAIKATNITTSGTGCVAHLYVDGIWKDDAVNGAYTPSTPAHTALNFRLGDQFSGSSNFDGMVHWAYFFNRALSDGQIKRLHDNPFALFAPRRVVVPMRRGKPGESTEPEALYSLDQVNFRFYNDDGAFAE